MGTAVESWQTRAWLRPQRRPQQGSCRGPGKGLAEGPVWVSLRHRDRPQQGSYWGSRGFPWQGSRQGSSSSGFHLILCVYDLYKDLHATTEVPPEPWFQCSCFGGIWNPWAQGCLTLLVFWQLTPARLLPGSRRSPRQGPCRGIVAVPEKGLAGGLVDFLGKDLAEDRRLLLLI